MFEQKRLLLLKWRTYFNCIFMSGFSILHEWVGRGEGESNWIWTSYKTWAGDENASFTVVKIALIHSTTTYIPNRRSERRLPHAFPQGTEHRYGFQKLQKVFVYSQNRRAEQYSNLFLRSSLYLSRGREDPGNEVAISRLKFIDTGFFVYILRNSCTWGTVIKSKQMHACITQIKL